jgi:hypothetical protein
MTNKKDAIEIEFLDYAAIRVTVEGICKMAQRSLWTLKTSIT